MFISCRLCHDITETYTGPGMLYLFRLLSVQPLVILCEMSMRQKEAVGAMVEYRVGQLHGTMVAELRGTSSRWVAAAATVLDLVPREVPYISWREKCARYVQMCAVDWEREQCPDGEMIT